MQALGVKSGEGVVFSNKDHASVPFSFEKRKKHMTSTWIPNNYMEAFRDNSILKARDLKIMAKK